jgi:hypothetical protein
MHDVLWRWTEEGVKLYRSATLRFGSPLAMARPISARWSFVQIEQLRGMGDLQKLVNGALPKTASMAQLPLNEHVSQVYGDSLSDLGFRQINCFKDTDHFGNELALYQNAHIRIRFVRDRGEETVQVSPLGPDAGFLDLKYLLEMLRPNSDAESNLACMRSLPQIKDDLAALFCSKYYKCFHRAYALYENCRNLSGLKMPDGTDLIDYRGSD